MLRVVCAAAARAAIAAHAAAEWPREACGLLIGYADADGAVRVLRAEPAANLSPDDDAFELDPALRLRLQREARAEGLAVVGHYHSHPHGGAEPSPRDRARAGETGLIWLIAAAGPEGMGALAAFVAVAGPDLAAAALD